MIYIHALVLIICGLPSIVLSQQIVNDCGLRKECIFISSCPNILEQDENDIAFCNEDGTKVCCAKRATPNNNRVIVNMDRPSVRACAEYHDRVYSNCSSIAGLIVSGTKAFPYEFPHMALLGASHADNTFSWKCGGSLISTRYVLTAAHCFNEELDSVRLGELDYGNKRDIAEPQDFKIKRYINHPDYAGADDQSYNDISLVELQSEARLNKFVVPACLPHTNGTEYNRLIAAGWGANETFSQHATTHLMKVILEHFNETECRLVYSVSDKLDEGINDATQLCAGSHTDSRDTCTGDSGGPLFIQHPHHSCMYMLVGITSFSISGCGIEGLPAVYTRVLAFVEWVEKIVWGN